MASAERQASPAAAGQQLARSGAERLLVSGTSILAFLLIWEAAARSGAVDPLFISSPTRIAAAFRRLAAEGDLWADIRVSFVEFAGGYSLAAAVGIPLGLAVGWYKRFYYLLSPFINAMNAVPRITLLPLIVIWLGIGLWSKIAVVFLGAVIPLLIHTFEGVKTNEARFVVLARSFGASEPKLFTSIVLPGTVPFIFTGLKYAAGRALLGVVVGEFYAASAGVGHLIGEAGKTLQSDELFVGVAIVMLAGLASVELLDRIERRFDRWRPKAGTER